MKLRVFIKIGRKQGLLGWDGERLIVCVDAPPINGAANLKLIKILSEWTGVSKNKIQIIKGHTSRHKTLDIEINQQVFNNLVNDLPQVLRQSSLFDDV